MKESITASQGSTFLITTFIASVVIAAAGAVMLVVYKNQQLQFTRNIEKMEKSTRAIYENDLPILQHEIEKQLDRYIVRDQLITNKSALRKTPVQNIIVIHPTNATASAP